MDLYKKLEELLELRKWTTDRLEEIDKEINELKTKIIADKYLNKYWSKNNYFVIYRSVSVNVQNNIIYIKYEKYYSDIPYHKQHEILFIEHGYVSGTEEEIEEFFNKFEINPNQFINHLIRYINFCDNFQASDHSYRKIIVK